MSWIPNERIANQQSKGPVALAVFGNRLHRVYHADDSGFLYHSIREDAGWSQPVRIAPAKPSATTPALAAFQGKLHLVYIDGSKRLWQATFDGARWSADQVIAPGQGNLPKSRAAPALAVFANRLHLVHIGETSNKLYHTTFDGNAWAGETQIPNFKSRATPAMAAYRNRLHVVHIGDTSNKLYDVTFDGTTWREELIAGHLSNLPPALAACDDELSGPCLHLVHVGEASAQLWHSMYDGRAFAPDARVPSQKAKSAPALAMLDGVPHLLHQGEKSDSLWASTYASPLGKRLAGPQALADGQVAYFEFGATFRGVSTGDELIAGWLDCPRLCTPAAATTDQAAPLEIRLVFGGLPGLPLRRATRQVIAQRRPGLFAEISQGRYALAAVGQTPLLPIPLAAGPSRESPADGTDVCRVTLPFQVGPGQSLEHRRLYDLLFVSSSASPVIAAHCLYARAEWHNFRLAHATDLHISARLDSFRQKLVDAQLALGAAAFNNCNDNLRDLIRYANACYERGELDGVLLTGDLVDYQFEADQAKASGGNFALLERLLLGQSPYPQPPADGGAAEELRVPVFASLGNHDWRANPYELHWAASWGPFKLREFRQYGSLNLLPPEADALQGGKMLERSSDQGFAMVRVDPAGLQYYLDRLCGPRVETGDTVRASYVVRLGPHRIVMIDTAQDIWVVDDAGDTLKVLFGLLNPDEATVTDGDPNSQGMIAQDLEHVRAALAESQGLVIVAAHAPPINLVGNEYPHYFRETEHATLAGSQHQVEGYLRRKDKEAFRTHDMGFYTGAGSTAANAVHRAFPRTGTGHLLQGKITELAHYNVASHLANELLKLCAGVGAARPADLVLCGHTHYNVECRYRYAGDDCVLYFDYYTESPGDYYPTQYSLLPTSEGGACILSTSRHGVHVDDAAPLPTAACTAAAAGQVPPYPQALNRSANPAAWWQQHRPLVMQTGGLGPLENLQRASDALPTFQGIRLLTIKNDVIAKIEYQKLAAIRAELKS
jgi:hypothetical protein